MERRIQSSLWGFLQPRGRGRGHDAGLLRRRRSAEFFAVMSEAFFQAPSKWSEQITRRYMSSWPCFTARIRHNGGLHNGDIFRQR